MDPGVMSQGVIYEGVDRSALAEAIAGGVDHAGNPIEAFTDTEGGWPLRCCLGDSAPGDRIAIIAWSPYRWNGPYRETGPVVVHTEGCPGGGRVERLPTELNRRPMTLRPYGVAHTILYDRVRVLEPDSDLSGHAAELLCDPDVVEVYGRNRIGGCFAFVARRDERPPTGPDRHERF